MEVNLVSNHRFKQIVYRTLLSVCKQFVSIVCKQGSGLSFRIRMGSQSANPVLKFGSKKKKVYRGFFLGTNVPDPFFFTGSGSGGPKKTGSATLGRIVQF